MPADLRSILSIEVPIIVRIASRRMSLEAIRAIGPGSIIEMPKPVQEDLELLVANKTIGRGRAVKVGDSYGLRITSVGDVQARIAALGQRPSNGPAPRSVEPPSSAEPAA